MNTPSQIKQGAVKVREKRTKENSIAKFKVVVDFIIANGRLPKRTSANILEYDCDRRLSNMKLTKRGKLQGIWYKEYDEMMAAAGYPEYFKCEGENEEIKIDIKDICDFCIEHMRVPSQKNKNEVELYNKLLRLRQIKQGKTPFRWNNELDRIVIGMGIPYIFDAHEQRK